MTTFRVSARVRLQLRLDEAGDTSLLRSKLEREPPKAATEGQQQDNRQERQALGRRQGVMSPSDVATERARLDQERTAEQSGASGIPEGFRENPGDERNLIFTTAPIEVDITRTGMKDASTAEIKFAFQDMPIDPRVVRSCFVAAAIGTVSADDFEAGILRQAQRPDGSLLSEVQVAPGQELAFRSTTQFLGWVDEWSVVVSEDGETITLDCRDVSAVLRDQRLPDGVKIDLTKPIRDGVQELVDHFPATRGMPVVLGSPLNAAAKIVVPEYATVPPAEAQPVVQKARKGKRAKKQRSGGKTQTAWEHIEQVCQTMALIPIMRGFTLYLSEPRVLFADFEESRKMVWGINLKRFELSRQLGGVIAPTIEMRSPDPSIGRTRWARYYPFETSEPTSGILGDKNSPQPVTQRASRLTANGNPSEEVRIYHVAGVTDQAALERIAASTFEEIGRQEIDGTFETDDVSSFEAQRDGDLLDLQSGEPVTMLSADLSKGTVDEYGATSFQQFATYSAAGRATYLKRLGMDPVMAERLAVAQDSVALSPTFRAGRISLQYSADEGVSLEVDFYNFILIREAPEEEKARQPVETLAQGAAL